MSNERRPGAGQATGATGWESSDLAGVGATEAQATGSQTESHWNCPGCAECNDLVNGLARQVGVYTVGTSDVEGCSQDVVDLTAQQHLEEIAATVWGDHPADTTPCRLCGERHPLEGACTL